ncbi:unnamed protein product [Gordionus sp. m RMFG-2023]|uniref:TBC1 domain family member 30-like isoform X1 n=1 Tax=Gordionus sp. m RMFG-2023 TaxID=3053472 RepID=UPI0030E18276
MDSGIDTKMRFSLSPVQNNDLAYRQWIRALKSLVLFPDGIPSDFRKQIWLNLADHYIHSRDLNWESIKGVCFNDNTNPDDYDLDAQIIKDLHRTNTAGVSGSSLSEEDRVILKRVLLAFARWNKKIGYCQGLNVIAALIIDVMEHNAENAFKVMIYLIEHILPPRYYTNNLTGLTVDMSVFRDLLSIRFPYLASHLEKLRQNVAKYDVYEPPLTNLFTMQWFITLFATCFPRETVLRIWDCLLLRGSEILLRTALVFWNKISRLLVVAENPDQFYAIMEEVGKRCLENGVISARELIKGIHDISPFPYKEIHELKDKYTYNISPFNNSASQRIVLQDSNFRLSDFNLLTLIKFINKKNTSHTLQDNDHQNRNVCDIKALRDQYKTICQRHKQSLIMSNFPHCYQQDTTAHIYTSISHTKNNQPIKVQDRKIRNKINCGESIITFDPTDCEIEPIINHLYIKPGPKAKHRKNRKAILYSS